MSLIADLQWRHAVKAYDASKVVADDAIFKIVEAARLAPTSSGLQPFQVLIVKDPAIKQELVSGAFNPECMRDCSHVLIFAAWDRYTAERIDEVYDRTTDERNLPRGRFSSYTDILKSMYLPQSSAENHEHIARQTYIALGLALAQAAALKIDTTPVEGFDNALVDRVLQLEKRGLKSVSLMYVGYADTQKDWMADMKKVRQPMEDFALTF